MEKSYLLLIASLDLRPLKSHLHGLEAFYNGIGYAIPEKNEAKLKSLCQKAGLRFHKQPLPSGHTFESFHQSSRAGFFRDRALEVEREIHVLKSELNFSDLSDEELRELPDIQKSFRGTQLIELLDKLEDLKEAIQRAESFEKALSFQGNSPLSIQFINEREVNFLFDDAPETPRLVNFMDGTIAKPFIRKGIVGMLVGAGGVGKTHALTQLAISIATGIDWLGKYPIEKPGYAFLGLGENSENDIHRLLRKTVKSMNSRISQQSSEDIFFDKDPFVEASKRLAVSSFTGANATFIHKEVPTAFYQSFLAELKTKEPEVGWSCIILDPISRFLGADAETDNASATQFISLLEKISLELKGNPSVIFGHHMNKSGVSGTNTDQAAARGSSAITDGVRWQCNLEKIKRPDMGSNEEESEAGFEPNQIRLKVVKSNFTAVLPPLKLTRDENGCLYEESPILSTAQTLKRKK